MYRFYESFRDERYVYVDEEIQPDYWMHKKILIKNFDTWKKDKFEI